MVPQPIPIGMDRSGALPQHDEEGQQQRDPYLSDDMMKAIYGSATATQGNAEDGSGTTEKNTKHEQYEESLRRWWKEYADRKNDEEDEYVANSLLYDRNHLPRTAPAPDCVVDGGGGSSRQGHFHAHGDAA